MLAVGQNIVRIVEWPLLVEWEHAHEVAHVYTAYRLEGVNACVFAGRGRRVTAVGALVVHGGQGQLFEVVRALHAAGGLTGRLHRREQERDQNGDDRDDNKELDECEAAAAVRVHKAGRGHGENPPKDGWELGS